MHLIDFDTSLAATVAAWPTSADEAFQWCGHRDVSAGLVADWARAKNVQAFTLLDGDTPVGYGELWPDSDEAADETELAHLIVAPERRGQGTGRRLAALLAQRCATKLVFLRVHPTNTPAIRAYRQAGFRSVDEETAAEWNTGQPVAYDWLVFDRE